MSQILSTLSGLFASIITPMIGSVAARACRTQPTFPVGRPGGVIPVPFAQMLITRFRRILPRFKILLALAQNAVQNPASNPMPLPSDGPKRVRKAGKPSVYLPWQFGWILEHAPNLANYGRQLQYLANLPEMQALIATEPRLGRIFRPLMNILGAELPAHLKLPRRKRIYKPRPPKPRKPRPRGWTLDYEKSKDTWTRAPETLPPWYCPPPTATAPSPQPVAAKPHPPPVEQVPYAVLIKRFIGHGQR